MKAKLFFGFFLFLLLIAGCEKEDQDLATKLSGTTWRGNYTIEVIGAIEKETKPAKRIFYLDGQILKVQVWSSGNVVGQISPITDNTFTYRYSTIKYPICNGVITLLISDFEGIGEIHGDSLIEKGTVLWTSIFPLGLTGDSITSEKNGVWSARLKLVTK